MQLLSPRSNISGGVSKDPRTQTSNTSTASTQPQKAQEQDLPTHDCIMATYVGKYASAKPAIHKANNVLTVTPQSTNMFPSRNTHPEVALDGPDVSPPNNQKAPPTFDVTSVQRGEERTTMSIDCQETQFDRELGL